MISLGWKTKMAAAIVAAMTFLGAVAPAAFAQSEAVKDAVKTLEESEELSPKDTLLGVVSVLQLQIGEWERGLSLLKGLNNEQLEERLGFYNALEEMGEFLTAVELGAEGGDIEALAAALEEWKAEVFDPQTEQIVNFLLVLQTKSVLRTAEARYLKIRSDVERLQELKILTGNKVPGLLKDALLLLTAARDLTEKAEAAYYDPESDSEEVRKLANGAISKIRLAYRKFIEISNLVYEALK